jgi:translation initiation factor 2 subunit 2
LFFLCLPIPIQFFILFFLPSSYFLTILPFSLQYTKSPIYTNIQLVDDLLLDSFKKKKGKKGKKAAAAVVPEEEEATTATTENGTTPEVQSSDYSYIVLLDRAFQQVRAANPETDRKKTTLPIPILTRGGPRKTIWNNFKQTCDVLQRGVEHFQQFVVAELGSEASLDATSQLIIRGKYTPKQVESLLRNYINSYVACPQCRSSNTVLTKDSVTRLVYIECNDCSCKRSVNAIKTGFHATSRADRKASRKAM